MKSLIWLLVLALLTLSVGCGNEASRKDIAGVYEAADETKSINITNIDGNDYGALITYNRSKSEKPKEIYLSGTYNAAERILTFSGPFGSMSWKFSEDFSKFHEVGKNSEPNDFAHRK